MPDIHALLSHLPSRQAPEKVSSLTPAADPEVKEVKGAKDAESAQDPALAKAQVGTLSHTMGKYTRGQMASGVSVLSTQGYEINSLWFSDAIWWHRSRSTLAQVMAWCLMAPSPLPEPMLTHHQWDSLALT